MLAGARIGAPPLDAQASPVAGIAVRVCVLRTKCTRVCVTDPALGRTTIGGIFLRAARVDEARDWEVTMSDLVERLSVGDHEVEISLRPERTVKALKESLDRGYVHVRFPNTRGGTELGLTLDPHRTDLSAADFDGATGRLIVVGELTLDFTPVRCVASIDLPALTGRGHLERTSGADRPMP